MRVNCQYSNVRNHVTIFLMNRSREAHDEKQDLRLEQIK